MNTLTFRHDDRANAQQLGICDDGLIPELQRLADAVKACGTVTGIQITHAGGKATTGGIGRQPITPSRDLVPGATEPTQAATTVKIAEIVTGFAAAAQQVVAAGFDFIEIPGAHRYLLSQFLSPLTNQRTDEYGNNLNGRLHLPLEVVRTVRQVVGPDYLLLYRLGANDYMRGGLTAEDGKAAAIVLAEAGVDLLDISGGLCGASLPSWDWVSQGYFVPIAAEIRAAVNAAVVVASGITAPEFADRIIRERKVDLVAIGRAMRDNPDWATDAQKVLLTA